MTPDRLALSPSERRTAVLDLVAGARERLLLSIFRCTDPTFVAALAAAADRGVVVEALLAARRHRWGDARDGLPPVLAGLGVRVHRRSTGTPPYHAKYLLADDGPAFVGSLNWTRRDFDRARDFGILTHDPSVTRGLAELFEVDCRGGLLDGRDAGAGRLLVAPERARSRFAALLAGARTRLEILDHKLRDPEMLLLVGERQRHGCSVRVLDGAPSDAARPHGRLMVVDGRLAVIGGTALSPAALDRRRELSLVVHEPALVEGLRSYFALVAEGGAPS